MDFSAQHFTHLADLAWIWAAQFLPRLGAAMLILGLGFVAVPAAVDLDQARQRLLEVAAKTPSTLHDPRQNCADSDRTPNAAGQRSVAISRRPRPSSRRMSSFPQLAHFLSVEEWRLNR
jgi:hypothetical protein